MMAINWFTIIQDGFFGGLAALGFAILFNVHKKNLLVIYLLGWAVVFTKSLLIGMGAGIVGASFCGAVVAGVCSQFAHLRRKTPPLVIATPSVIPMVPGILLYRMMIGLLEISFNTKPEQFSELLAGTVSNGLKALFVLFALSLGLSLPYLLIRKKSIVAINS